MDKKKLRRAPLFVVALAAALPFTLGACSSSSSSSSSDPSAAQPGSSSSANAGQAQVSLCMRQKGVTNFPDPQNGHFVIPSSAENNPNFRSAIQACQHLLGPSGATNSTANQQADLAFAHCMQTHGVANYPDPSSNGALVAPPASVRNAPGFQTAYNECKSNLPGGNGLQG